LLPKLSTPSHKYALALASAMIVNGFRSVSTLHGDIFVSVCKIEQNTRGGGHNITEMSYGWNPPYTAAVLETDWSKMPERILAAETAIKSRLQEFSLDHGGTPEENQAIIDTMQRLGVLRSDLVLWREPKARR
jgi:hypothetical protein